MLISHVSFLINPCKICDIVGFIRCEIIRAIDTNCICNFSQRNFSHQRRPADTSENSATGSPSSASILWPVIVLHGRKASLFGVVVVVQKKKKGREAAGRESREAGLYTNSQHSHKVTKQKRNPEKSGHLLILYCPCGRRFGQVDDISISI